MIYEYDDSINFLKSTLQKKAKLNSSYSLRAFAKKLGLSPGGLSLILNKKKKLSVERAYEVAMGLELKKEEAEYFLALIQLEAAKSSALRMQYLERLKSLNPHFNEGSIFKQSLLTLEHFKLISEWYGLAILELITELKGNWDAKSIAKKMGLSKIEVEVVVERLLKLELIQEKDVGGYERVVETLLVESPLANDALRSYYEGVHEESRKSIRAQSPAEKVIGAQVFAFDVAQLEDVRKLTNDYLDQLNDLAARGNNKTEVYQAIANVFKLTKQESL